MNEIRYASRYDTVEVEVEVENGLIVSGGNCYGSFGGDKSVIFQTRTGGRVEEMRLPGGRSQSLNF